MGAAHAKEKLNLTVSKRAVGHWIDKKDKDNAEAKAAYANSSTTQPYLLMIAINNQHLLQQQ